MYQLLSLHVFVSNQTCRKLCINFSSPTNQTMPQQGEESLIGEFGGKKKSVDSNGESGCRAPPAHD